MSAYAYDENNKRLSFSEVLTEVYNYVYPVGSIYMSVNNINPSTIFGGTWEAWGSGKVPVGVDAEDSDFSTVESTGGEKEHTLTVSEMPHHSHSFSKVYSNGTDYPEYNAPILSSWRYSGTQLPHATNNTGSDEAHNNLQPYITCYMWKRTA